MTVLSGLLQAGGAFLTGRSQAKAAEDAAEGARFNPFNVTGPGGTSSIDGQNINLQLGGAQGEISSRLLGQAGGALNQNSPEAQRFAQIGLGGIPSLFGAAQGVQTGLPGQFNTLSGNLDRLGGLFSQAGGQGLNQAFGSPTASPFTQGLFGQGQELLGTQFGDVEQQALARSRALARPGEENATQAALDRLFSQGRLGTTGGAQVAGQLAQAQEFADIQRQQNATSFANQLRQQDRQLGQGLFSQGLQGIGLDQARGANLGGLGAGLFSQVPGLQGTLFNAAGAVDTSNINRAQQRLANAQGLFGFGRGIEDANLQRTSNLLGVNQGLAGGLLQQAGLGLEGGAASAAAGANAGLFGQQAAFSPFGAALSGFGAGGGADPLSDFAGNQLNRLQGLFGGSGVIGTP